MMIVFILLLAIAFALMPAGIIVFVFARTGQQETLAGLLFTIGMVALAAAGGIWKILL